jgi:hypothetical protein
MRLLKRTSVLSAVFIVSIFSGCGDVFDSINENILDIKDKEEEIDSDSSSGGDGNSSTSSSGGIDVDVNINDQNSTSTTSSGGSSGDSTTSSGGSSGDSTTSSGGSSGDSTTSSGGSDDQNYTFSLSFPNFENKKAIDLTMGFNDEETIQIAVTPEKPDLNLEMKEESNGVLKRAEILREGASDGNIYSFHIESDTTAGEESFRLQLDSGYFSDFVDIDVSIIKQIKIDSARSTYSLLVGGDEQEITIEATNLQGNPLEFYIEEFSDVNDRDIMELTYSGQRAFSKNTDEGVKFVFLAKGLIEGTEKITVRVKDTEVGYVDSIPITLQSNRANRQLLQDLYECGSSYSGVNLKEYEVTVDANTPASLTGTASNDKALTLLSTYDLKYDIGNEFSTVMLFHPRQITYTQTAFGKYYIYLQGGQKKHIGTIYYGKSLEDREFFVKYYNENTNGVVCESHRFPPMEVISSELVIQETSDNTDATNLFNTDQ